MKNIMRLLMRAVRVRRYSRSLGRSCQFGEEDLAYPGECVGEGSVDEEEEEAEYGLQLADLLIRQRLIAQ